MTPQPSIREVEEMVGKKAADILVRQRDIVLIFCGGRTESGGLAGNLEWRIPTKLSTNV